MRIRRSAISTMIRLVVGLFVVSSIIIALLTLAGPSLGNMMLYDGAWVEYASPGDRFNNLSWSEEEGVVTSPDGTKVAAIEPDTPRPNQGWPCTQMVRVREAGSQAILASMRCGDFYYTWQPSRIAWLDDSTVAVDTGAVVLWRWTVFIFPVGSFWLILYAVVAIPLAWLAWRFIKGRRQPPAGSFTGAE